MYQGHSEVYFYVFWIFKWYPERWNFYRFLNKSFFLQSATRGANVCKNGKQPRPEKFMLDRGKVCAWNQKRVRSYLQPFSDRSQKFPKYPEQYLYKIPLLSSELSSSISNQVFGKFSSMFWYLPWVGSMHKSIMVRRPSTPFENIQPISQTFEYHGRDWRKS